MTEPFDPSLARLLELASLPPGDPRRTDLEQELASLPDAERAMWRHMMHETDLLYGSLPEVEVPPDLQSRLLRIPDAPAAAAGTPSVALDEPAARTPLARISPRRFRLYAACLLILLPLAGIAIWNMPRSDTTPQSFALAAPKAVEIADLAEALHDAPPPLTITSGDPHAVEEALTSAMKPYDMPFPPIVPAPKKPLTLLGGGVAAFGATHAAFTRWTNGSSTFTLYQFDGKPLHLPPTFTTTLASASHGHVVSIWPGYGNPCTWALVANNKSNAALFD
ncbi:MAG: hypothetical protein ACTHN5_01780 [Phycisphaerae bacterium]